MRRTGKTTRLIDGAVQALFDNGKIIVPTRNQVFDSYDKWKRGLSSEQINDLAFIDPDISDANEAQSFFLKSLRRRLNIEHPGAFEEKGNVFRLKRK